MKLITCLVAIIICCNSYNLTGQSTLWTEKMLISNWGEKGIDNIEGIYEEINNESGKAFGSAYKYAVLKSSETDYQLILLVSRSGIITDAKCSIQATFNMYNFNARWINCGYVTGYRDISVSNNYMTIEAPMGKWEFEKQKINIPKPDLTGSGSGFAIASSGIIATNYHVVEKASSINVIGIGGDFTKSYKANILVFDKINDIALLKISDNSFKQIDSIPYVINNNLSMVGENIFVLGYPLLATMGEEIKLTNGIISSKTGYQGDITSYQISAPAQPGNSGGPLFNNNGEVIGIVNSKLFITENVTYAIKSNLLNNLIQLLPNPPVIKSINLLANKPLTAQVQILKNFIYIIETK